MEVRANQTHSNDESPELRVLLSRILLLDLEVSTQGKLLKVGAALGEQTFFRSGNISSTSVLDDLTLFASPAACMLGHNLIEHDLSTLREHDPSHPLLKLPVIDTLILSPIAFPENPYHRLIKDYKLVSESVNDPVADARQAGAVFADEFRSLAGLQQTEPRLFALLHYLLTTPAQVGDTGALGMEMVFTALGRKCPSLEIALQYCRELFRERACCSVPVEASLLATAAQRLAIAYATTWLRVAGSNSVLPPWVRIRHPQTVKLLRQLREVPCSAPDCAYCRRVHNATDQLKAFFGFSKFRATPKNGKGGSLQQDIIETGMRDESMLAILPTGGGKSLCYQLPALVRNYRRGVLTIIISPLQALMKDQVDGLVRRTGTPFAAALYGMLTPPERGDVLRRVRLGDVALLYVSPEQLRNRSFREAIAQREIGCWVFDEAHCLSKWGHDFRPDYLYAGRFIREFSQKQGTEIPSIACFTATAKRDVTEEIIAYFKAETGRELRLFEGGVERTNLRFVVQTVSGHSKLERIGNLLAEYLPNGRGGSAIIFRSTREATEVSAEYLRTKGWKAAFFHAGMSPSEKKQVQDDFLGSEIQVICATNAFGMGIDKEDVRLVIHADTPGSLENYLQEAGRAGRDGDMADCILLFDEQDCEHQFRMGAMSKLSRQDIAQILRGLRKATRGNEEVVITTGEILRDEDLQTNLTLQDTGADTKVRTAISWLERAGFILRDENVTNVFQARLLVRNLEEARARMATLNLSQSEQALWLAIIREFIGAKSTESLTVDRLAMLPEFKGYAQRGFEMKAGPEYLSAKILKILGNMAQAGLMKRDLLLNAYVRYKVADHSRIRLERALALDRKLVDVLAVEEPDPEGWMPLALRHLNQRLSDEGCESSVELVRLLLKSLGEDGRGMAGTRGSIDLRHLTQDSYRVRVNRSWQTISDLAEKRRRVATLVLDVLLDKIPASTPPKADLLVDFSFAELHDAIERDLILRSELKDIDAALERALMYLHEQRVIILQQGLAVFRSAMTIRMQPEAKGEKYKVSDYQPLAHHYGERVLQVHVMSEYARRGLEEIREALSLVLAYFKLDKETFIRSYLALKPEMLQQATTAKSYQQIVTDLSNPAQMKVVTAPTTRNMLILAGPGSGKTKTVVHRCAYLLRVERVRPQSVLICCFNRSAAIELRRRLANLVGDDARGVTILTYHGLALRLLGRSLTRGGPDRGQELNFDELIGDAVKLLRGEQVPAGLEVDEVRDRLLAGFRFILVDEYQDIDEGQYQMISAIAGKTLEDADQKLSILAVGDDDQNIYTFRGANVQFIRKFQEDYQAEIHHLVENYRSTKHIIEASNQLISANQDRMKSKHPIRIDRSRIMQPPGGEFEQRDALGRGKVQIINVPLVEGQAFEVIRELGRLRDLGVKDWNRMAVLSSTHQDLALVRALAEQAGLPVRWYAGRGALPPLHQIRELDQFLAWLKEDKMHRLARASALIDQAKKMFSTRLHNPWTKCLLQFLEDWRLESDNAELPAQEALDFLYEACADSRREFSYGEGVILSTVHSAKGTEHDHVVLIGAWSFPKETAEQEEARRVFYVGMTRARKTLTILCQSDVQLALPKSLTGPAVQQRIGLGGVLEREGSARDYQILSLEDVYLGYPGMHQETHAIHLALAQLEPGAKVRLNPDEKGVGIYDASGTCVGRLSRKAAESWKRRTATIIEARVVAMVRRQMEQDDEPERRKLYKSSSWELPIIEVVTMN